VIASASDDKTIRIWDSTTYALLHTFTGHTDLVLTLAYAPDGELASGSSDKTVRFWNPDGSPARPNMTFATDVRRVLFTPDGKEMVVAVRDGTDVVVDLATGTRREIPVGAAATDIAISPDGRTLAVGDDDGGTSFYPLT